MKSRARARDHILPAVAAAYVYCGMRDHDEDSKRGCHNLSGHNHIFIYVLVTLVLLREVGRGYLNERYEATRA